MTSRGQTDLIILLDTDYEKFLPFQQDLKMNSHLIIYIFVAEVVPAGSDIWEVQYFFLK